jgi:hypothetical protein
MISLFFLLSGLFLTSPLHSITTCDPFSSPTFLSLCSLASLAQSAHIFDHVFGSTRFLTHFNSDHPLKEFKTTASMIGTTSGSYVACCEYHLASVTHDSLLVIYDEVNIHTSYISETNNLACFLILSSNLTLDSLDPSLEHLHLRSHPCFLPVPYFPHPSTVILNQFLMN